MRNYTVQDLAALAERKGYKIFHGGQGYNLNIWGIRSADRTSNAFNDAVYVFWLDVDINLWQLVRFTATTDPGLYWREQPMHQMGTAILKTGQYEGCWKMGKHNGYEALVQCKPVVVYRDNNRDNILDIAGENVDVHAGVFGINIHRANINGRSVQVDKWSAGCQVLQNQKKHHSVDGREFNHDWDYLVYLLRASAAIYNEYFTYTLVDENDFLEN